VVDAPRIIARDVGERYARQALGEFLGQQANPY
jgi:hypothetical protein